MPNLLVLVVAAVLEVGGDAAIRYGLVRATPASAAIGSLMLVAYGFLVNANRMMDFGRLMGVYIAVFFVVSQVLGVVGFGESAAGGARLVGGALIVAGGLVIQLAS